MLTSREMIYLINCKRLTRWKVLLIIVEVVVFRSFNTEYSLKCRRLVAFLILSRDSFFGFVFLYYPHRHYIPQHNVTGNAHTKLFLKYKRKSLGRSLLLHSPSWLDKVDQSNNGCKSQKKREKMQSD